MLLTIALLTTASRSRSDWYEHSLPVVTSSSESEFEPGGGAARRRRRREQTATDFVRMTSRRKGVISYKESSSEEVEEGLGGGEGEGPPVEDNRETIEKVLKKRMGRVGGKRERERSWIEFSSYGRTLQTPAQPCTHRRWWGARKGMKPLKCSI